MLVLQAITHRGELSHAGVVGGTGGTCDTRVRLPAPSARVWKGIVSGATRLASGASGSTSGDSSA